MQRIAKYLVTFTPKCFVPAVTTASAELRGTGRFNIPQLREILRNKICKISQFLCRFVNSAHDVNSAHVSAESQNSDIPSCSVFAIASL